MEQEDIAYLQNLENQNYELQRRNMDLSKVQSSMYDNENNQNLIEWQLELDNILERIDHLLRGHELKFDDAGNLTWREPTNKDNIVFNEYGVQEILRVLSMYLNRNTILSNYDDATIQLKMYDFGIELSDLVFLKYEEMGLDTEEKRKLYPIIIRELIDTIHSAYLRALNGGERESLRTARVVNQSQPLNQLGLSGMPNNPQSSFSIFKPTTWIKH